MSNVWTALIAAGAAILSSVLTSYLTHRFDRRRRAREYELKWLEDRFGPALDFLGKVLAIVSNTANTPEGRKQTVDEIRNIVTGPAKDSNAWYIAILLDPEDSGLRDYVQSAMTYARIAESDNEFRQYQVRLHLNLEVLATEFRKERQAITAGKSLESLIQQRKSELEKTTRELGDGIQAVRSFLNGEADAKSALARLERSNVRSARLDWVFQLAADTDDPEKQTRARELRRTCEQRRWLGGGQRRLV